MMINQMWGTLRQVVAQYLRRRWAQTHAIQG